MKLVNLSIKILVGIILLTFIISSSSENKSKITSTSTVATESNLNHGIFLNDKVFKYKNLKKNLNRIRSKSEPAAAPIAPATPSAPSDPTSTGGNQSAKKQESGPILERGWIKYFRYKGKNGIPKEFKVNNQFYEQSKYFPNANLKAKKDGMNQYISDKNYFFFFLFENSFTINSSLLVRKNKFFI